MRTWRIALGAVVVAGTVLVIGAPPAATACHAFTIEASPASVTEGASVTVTVERDGTVGPSSVRVTSVNGSATGGSDFQTVNQMVEFVTEKQKSFNVQTTNDSAAEAAETFKLRLSDPGGCGGGSYSLGPDATVTIADNDQVAPAPTTTAKPIASPTTKAGQATTTTAGATTTSESTTTTEDSTTTTDGTLAIEQEDDGSNAGVIAALVAGAAGVLGAIGYLLYRRRAAGLP